MTRIDETRPFIPVRIAVLTISDTRTPKTDKSGPLLASLIKEAGHELAEHAIAEDNVKAIRKQVKRWIKDPQVDVVITTGGTGFTGRDVTPEAVQAAVREGDRRLLGAIPSAELSKRRHLDGAVASLRRRHQRHLYLLRARITRSLRGCVERHPQGAARQSPPSLLVHRDHAAARRRPAKDCAKEEIDLSRHIARARTIPSVTTALRIGTLALMPTTQLRPLSLAS